MSEKKDVNGKVASWETIHQTLIEIAERRADLDAKEAFWLREAIAQRIWKRVGMVSIIDYMERVLEHRPQTARERVRVAKALGELPQLARALARKQLRYSAVKELTRIATAATEAEWIAEATGKSARAIEKLVSGRKKGDRPSDPADPDTSPRDLCYRDVSPETVALLRQARHVLDERAGHYLDDNELLAMFATSILDGGSPASEATGQARYQIGLTVCEGCKQGWQHGAGVEVPVSAATVERAHCDAQHIGSVDAPVPARAYQDVSPSIKRLVHHRDRETCRVPDCRSSIGLEIHHIVPRSRGGSHLPINLALLCSSCHQAHHEGRLTIGGTAKNLIVKRIELRRSHVGDIELPAGVLEVVAEFGAKVDVVDPDEPFSHVGDIELPGGVVEARVASPEPTVDAFDRDEPAPISHVGDIEHPPGVLEKTVTTFDRDLKQAIEESITSENRRHDTTGLRLAVRADGVDTGSAKLARAIVHRQSRDALVGLGWNSGVARRAVDAAFECLGDELDLERVISASLRECMKIVRS